jgi:flagellin
MSTYINTNTTAYMASLNLDANTAAESKDIERLSTGLKINSAADDPAGLVTSEDESAQLSGLNQATDNTNNAINLTQTAEGALNQVQTLLVSMRQLAVAASQTGTNNSTELAADQAQITSAIQSINNISTTTQFNNSNLLDGSANALGTTTPGSASLSAATAGTSLLAEGSYTSALSGASITTNNATYTSQASAAVTGMTTANAAFSGSIVIGGTSYAVGQNYNATGPVDGTAQTLSALNTEISGSGFQASVSANELVLTSTTAGVNTTAVTLTGLNAYTNSGGTTTTAGTALTAGTAVAGANTYATVTGLGNSVNSVANGASTIYSFGNGLQIETGTPAAATTSTTSSSVGSITSVAGTTTSGKALEFQIGANEGQTVSLSIQSTAADQLGTDAANYTNAAGATVTPTTQNVASINVSTFSGAQDAIAVLDQAINQVSTVRANLGAFQTNVLQSNATSLGVSTQNLQSAQATVEDTDMASQVVDYTKNSILVSAATSALTYANQEPQSILKLLQ